MPRSKKRQKKNRNPSKPTARPEAVTDENRERVLETTPEQSSKKNPEVNPNLNNDTIELLSRYGALVKCRTVLEFALLSLVASKKKVPPQPEKMTNQNTNPSKGGWERLMNPVQDLGRSLINFLVGGNNSSANSQSATDGSQQGTGSRQRPMGHPANPSTHSTPIILRRKASEPSPKTGHSHEANHLKQDQTSKPNISKLPPTTLPKLVIRDKSQPDSRDSSRPNSFKQSFLGSVSKSSSNIQNDLHAASSLPKNSGSNPVPLSNTRISDPSPARQSTPKTTIWNIMEKTSSQPDCPPAPAPCATRRKRNKNTNDSKESETSTAKSSIVESEKNIKMLESKVSVEKTALESVDKEADRIQAQVRSRSSSDRQRDISRSKMALKAFRERSRSKASRSVTGIGTTSTDAGLPDRLSKLVPSSSEETFFSTALATPRDSCLFQSTSSGLDLARIDSIENPGISGYFPTNANNCEDTNLPDSRSNIKLGSKCTIDKEQKSDNEISSMNCSKELIVDKIVESEVVLECGREGGVENDTVKVDPINDLTSMQVKAAEVGIEVSDGEEVMNNVNFDSTANENEKGSSEKEPNLSESSIEERSDTPLLQQVLETEQPECQTLEVIYCISAEPEENVIQVSEVKTSSMDVVGIDTFDAPSFEELEVNNFKHDESMQDSPSSKISVESCVPASETGHEQLVRDAEFLSSESRELESLDANTTTTTNMGCDIDESVTISKIEENVEKGASSGSSEEEICSEEPDLEFTTEDAKTPSDDIPFIAEGSREEEEACDVKTDAETKINVPEEPEAEALLEDCAKLTTDETVEEYFEDQIVESVPEVADFNTGIAKTDCFEEGIISHTCFGTPEESGLILESSTTSEEVVQQKILEEGIDNPLSNQMGEEKCQNIELTESYEQENNNLFPSAETEDTHSGLTSEPSSHTEKVPEESCGYPDLPHKTHGQSSSVTTISETNVRDDFDQVEMPNSLESDNFGTPIPPPPPPPPPGFLPQLIIAEKVVAKKPSEKSATTPGEALLRQLNSLKDDTFASFLKSNLPLFRSTRDRNEEGVTSRRSGSGAHRPSSRRLSECETSALSSSLESKVEQGNQQECQTSLSVIANKLADNDSKAATKSSLSAMKQKQSAPEMKKVIHKSDSGFADGLLNDRASRASIVKSDSGFLEKAVAQEEDDDDQVQPEKSRDLLSVADAHKLFHKRFAAVARAEDPVADHSMANGPRKGLSESSGEDEEDDDDEEEEEDDDESIVDRGLRSRTNSTESLNNETNLNVVALKEKLHEIEEKFRQAMVVNSSLDNDKSSLTYQIELLKDQMEEAEEETAMIIKEFREKNRAYELLKQQHMETQRAVELLQKQLEDQSRLLDERGMVLVGDDCDDLPDADDSQEARTQAIVSKETALILSGLGKGPLDTKIRRLADERDRLRKEVKRLELDLEDEQNKSVARKPMSKEEMEDETKKLIEDYKFKLQKDEQDILVLQANVSRLELQVTRFQGAAESAEQSEIGLKADKKKLERELREARNKIEELETANRHLQGRMEKLKTAKSNLLKEL